MELNKNIKTYIISLLIIVLGVSIISCDSIKDDNESLLQVSETKSQQVKINIEEAKILSDVSILNETIIAFTALSLEKKCGYRVNRLSINLKKDVLKIKSKLNSFADKNLILLPNKFDEQQFNNLSRTYQSRFLETYLTSLEQLLKSQILNVEFLSFITNDLDFKILSVNILEKLHYSVDQIHEIIKHN